MKNWLTRRRQPLVRSSQRIRGTPRLEILEDRAVPATIAVTTAVDSLVANDGVVSLREAITAINAGNDLGDPDIAAQSPGTFGTSDTINFNIAAAGVQTINVGADSSAAGIPLPTLLKPVVINGYSQPGTNVNNQLFGSNAVLLIELNGTSAGAGANGLVLGAGSGGSTVRGLILNRFAADGTFNGGNGVLVQSNGNTIAGNFIGVDSTGSIQRSNGGDGIRIVGASNNTIGGTGPDARNIVAGNQLDGIHILGTVATPSTNNVIRNNYVGVGQHSNFVGTRTVAVPEGAAVGTQSGNFRHGIEISGGVGNSVIDNVVGFNTEGIVLNNGAQNNIIQSNSIGIINNQTIGNFARGIVIHSGLGAPYGPPQVNEPGTAGNQIGGTTAGAGNIIRSNQMGGVAVFGNPLAASGQGNLSNSILGNSIFGNHRVAPATLPGIDLSNQFPYPTADGVTANDSRGHSGLDPNGFQNFPILTAAEEGPVSNRGTTIRGTLTSNPNTTYRIEFFASDPSAFGPIPEGQQFIGAITVTTDGAGRATFNTNLFRVVVASGRIITATATDPAGNTSEFSPGVVVAPPGAAASDRLFAVGSGAGAASTVFAYNADGSMRFGVSPYGGYAGGVTVAVGDVSGDGVADVVTGAGPGAPGGHVKVFDGRTGQEIRSFLAFTGFDGGVAVAAGDVNGDGIADIIVGASNSASGHVKVFDGRSGNLLLSFFSFQGFGGAISVGAGDIDGDGRADILVGASAVGGHVKVFSGADGGLLRSFFAYPGFVGPVFVAAGDVDGDGRADVITGAGANAHVKVFSGTSGAELRSFLAFAGFPGAARVGATDVNGDGRADILVGAGPGAGSNVRVFDGATLGVLRDFLAFGGFAGGVFVGGAGR